MKTTKGGGTADTDAVVAIADRFHCQPAFVARGSTSDGFYAAQWRLPPHQVSTECIADHILCCIREGSRSVSKLSEGRTVRKYARPGVVSFAPNGDSASYTMQESITLLELYISPAQLLSFAEEHSASGRGSSVQPFFAVEDPWLKAYFQMLTSEFEMYGESSLELDSLLLSQSQQMLFGHLLRCYGDLSGRDLREIDHPRAQSA